MIRTTLVSVALTAVASIAQADVVETFETQISYTADLLDFRAGADIVLEEIERQAHTACEREVSWRLEARRLEGICADDLVLSAVMAIDNSFLFEASESAGYDVATKMASLN
ncbi:MAG: UrcA family protein [Pseudomonadota bacterium]